MDGMDEMDAMDGAECHWALQGYPTQRPARNRQAGRTGTQSHADIAFPRGAWERVRKAGTQPALFQPLPRL